MKRSYLYRLCGALLALLSAAACAQDDAQECLPCRQTRSVDIRLAGAPSASELAAPLYLFSRATGTQEAYRLIRSYESVTDGQALKLPLADLNACEFRFLMVAQPGSGAWLSMQTADGQPFVPGGAWDDLRLASASGSAAADGYCGVLDMSGEEILRQGTVRLTLTRIAGRMLFDFFRTESTALQPVSVVSTDVASVIDRVTRIEIEYANPTTALCFGTDNRLEPAAYASEPLRQTILPEATDFKVALPQTDKGLLVYLQEAAGSLRIEGEYLLPSDAQVRVRMVFTYYDTTPSCGNNHTGDHGTTCYEQREVTLDLPAASAAAGLPVAADYFTVNRAGLRCDRIIDVPANGGFEADFTWL